MEITEEQRRRAEANRLAALERRKRAAESSQQPDAWRLFKCPKIIPAPPPAQKPPPPPPPPPLPGFRVVLEICSPDEFSVSPEPLDESPFPGETECLRTIENCLLSVVPFSLTQSQNGRLSSIFKLSDYDQVLKCLKKLRQIKIQDIPYKTRLVVQKFAPCTGTSWIPLMEGHCTDEQVEDLLSNIPPSLRNALLPFQLEGVRFGLRRGGRCLIADEMGLGKTLQAITIACCFKSEGSILIVCPAVLRYSWAEELERWIPIFLPNDIHLVFGHQNSLHYLEHCPKVVIISYRMLSRLKKSMIDKNWALMIIDESHNIRCTKKKAEKDETKTILELASTIKRIVLLSGTPSLSRPYDIYHQINILWPQLLGSNKYEFAKNYCLLGAVKGSQGKLYQDFSKGTRLSELNVLLRQTLMIRRLKEHVLDQLPPKRRQIIRLKLKAADIQLASTACKERRSDICYSQHPNSHCEGLDQVDAQGGNGCKKLLKDLSPQEIGIAKLSGFSEWFSNNCITSKEPDSDVDVDMQYGPQKTIIFGHHLKVLDGIQASISNNGIKFVRIDGSTTPRERQNAVESFRSSSEVKVAIIGITAGGVGLDFSSARNVIFLELPKTASDLLQAEDRAHRRGQKNAVNIYIFCAKGTADELNWPRLNKNLFSVSSVMNGKKDAINEFEVDDVFSFSRGSDDQMQTEELDSTAKKTSSASRLQVIEEPGATLSDQKEINEDFLIRTVPFIVMDHDSHLREQAQMDVNVENCSSVTSLDGESSCISRKSKQRIMSSAGTSNSEDASFLECGELDAVGDIRAEYLRFEVSQHTGRIHLYVCIPERDSRPRPLYENLRPEELESPISSGKGLITTLLLKSDTKFHHVLLKFLSEWGNLRPIERNKLLGKPLQLPLSIELCYLKETINRSSQGLLKGGSNRRVTPHTDISNSLPENAEWKKVILCGGPSKEWEYTQAWIGGEQPLCKLCQRPCNGKLAKSPEYFEDLFCNLTCFQEYRIRTSQSALRQNSDGGIEHLREYVCYSNFCRNSENSDILAVPEYVWMDRNSTILAVLAILATSKHTLKFSSMENWFLQALFQIEHGICDNCKLDCSALVKCLRPLSVRRRIEYIKQFAPNIAAKKKLLNKIANEPTEGNSWHADHKVAVYQGGGECTLENLRTLCVACHYEVTKAQCHERKLIKQRAKELLKNANKENGKEEDDEDLLVSVPGSSYSGRETDVSTISDK